MATTTTNYELTKPDAVTEYYDIDIVNANMDKIDTALAPTADPALVPTGVSGKMSQWVSWIANRIKAITGKANWYDAPSKSLEDLNTHLADITSQGYINSASKSGQNTQTITANGKYVLNGGINMPLGVVSAGTYWLMDVSVLSTTLLVQYITCIKGNATVLGKTFRQYCNDGVWSGWEKTLSQTDLIMPACRVYGVQQSIASNTDTAIAFNAERFDTDSIHDTVTNNSRLTCKTAGEYSIFGHVVINPGTGNLTIGIKLNGTTPIAQTLAPLTSGGTPLSIATVYGLAVNDYVELVVNQSNSTAINVLSAASRSPEFGMVKVGS